MNGYEDDNLRVISRFGNVGEIAAWKCICKHCGRTFTTKGSNIRNGATTSCGCINSKNEQFITALLQENGIDFEAQYTFPDLVGIGGRHLRFDFAIFANGELVRLVEFNGAQHYQRPEGSWSDQYDALLENDRRKVEYCRKNNIDLKIIKYSDQYSLSDILE